MTAFERSARDMSIRVLADQLAMSIVSLHNARAHGRPVADAEVEVIRRLVLALPPGDLADDLRDLGSSWVDVLLARGALAALPRTVPGAIRAGLHGFVANLREGRLF